MDKYLETMPDDKKKFIKDFMLDPKPTDSKKVLPFIIKYLEAAKKKNINFSKEEVIFLYNLYCDSFSKEEKEKLNKILNILQ